MEPAACAPFNAIWNQEGFTSAFSRRPRRKAARPATNSAAAEAIELKDLTRPVSVRTPAVSATHSCANWARLSSLSAINNRFRDSSGFIRGLFPDMYGPFLIDRGLPE